MLQLLRTSPGLAIGFVLLCGGALVCTLLGFLMARSGASLRPIYWFAGFFALIIVPQLIGHVCLALRALEAEAPRTAALDQIARRDPADKASLSNAAKILFGPDVDPQLITDARNTFGGAFSAAELAPFAILPDGTTVILARFKSTLVAEKAWVEYLRTTGLNQLGGTGDSQRGYVVTRPVGDRAYVLHAHSMVGVWTGANDDAIRQRMIAGGFEIPRRAPLKVTARTATSRFATINQSHPKKPLPLGLIGAGLAFYLIVVVFYFFKGAAWAATYRPKPGVTAVSSSELAARLEALNALDIPFHLERGASPSEFLATWRYANAKWIDLARARGMNRTFRIRLMLDERAGTVRATDYTASFDWSAGRGGADLEWKAAIGIVFFQSEQHRVYGLQLDDRGNFKPELSYAYTFNLNEMKSPLVEAVTGAGWKWRPTIWQGPTWLRWLTE